MRRLRAALLCLLWAGRPAQAAFEDLGAGARAPGMGNAFTALADDVYALHYNPAGLGQLERPQFAASYSKLYGGLDDGSDLGSSQLLYAHPLKEGKRGGLGVSLERFGLSDLYTEQTLFMGYGKGVYRSNAGSRLLLGLSAKYLSHSFQKPAEASNACAGGNCNGLGVDPVLNGKNSKSAIGSDLGFLYRFPRRFQTGLMVQNWNRPNVGFSDPDKLPMNIRLGLAYKTLWMSLTGELKMDQGSTGSRDRDMIIAAERIFPTLEHGQFGLRGSLGIGSRDWKQLTMGFSYRINKILIDYAFLLPIGVLSSQTTHRISLGFHFGAPSPDDEITQSLLTQAKQHRETGPSYGYEYAAELRPHDLQDPRLAAVRQLIEAGKYREASVALKKFVESASPAPSLMRLSNRLDLVAFYYPEFLQPKNRAEIVAKTAIGHFLAGHDRKSVLQASYALSMGQEDAKLDNFLAKVEQAVGVKAERLPPGHPRGFIDEMLYRVEAANNRREYEKVHGILKDILEMEPENITALERVGSTYFVMGRFQEAVDAWEWALPLEKDPQEVENLRTYIRSAREKLGPQAQVLPGERKPLQHPSASLPETKPAPPVALPVLAPAADAAVQAAPQSPAKGDPRDVNRLYQLGVEHYARGEYLQAASKFMRILQIDPGNSQAKKALERIERKKNP